MRPTHLVLVRWHDDVIATQTLGKGQAPNVSALPPDAPVSLEVVDVTTSRASFRAPLDTRPWLLVLGSVALHGALGLFLLTSSRNTSPKDTEADRLASLRAYTAKLAVSDKEPTPEVHIAEQSASAPEVTAVAVTTIHHEPSPPVTRRAGAVSHDPLHGMKGGDAKQSSAPAVCAVLHTAASAGPMCSRTVVVRSLTRSSPGCFTDDVISVGDRGTVTFPCSGDGAAKLTFGRASFDGAESDGKVNVCTGTQFPWSDGCTWTSAQQVTGSIESGVLHFSYGEAPRADSAHGCASACSAAGSIDVQR